MAKMGEMTQEAFVALLNTTVETAVDKRIAPLNEELLNVQTLAGSSEITVPLAGDIEEDHPSTGSDNPSKDGSVS